MKQNFCRPEVTAEELAQLLDTDASPVLVDVREAWEFGICALPGARLLPLGALPARMDDLQGLESSQLVTVCHHGVRSLKAALWLHSQGFQHVRSLAGGIDRWARTIDLSMPVY
jgi:rhodanese-related sulfurtransferase